MISGDGDRMIHGNRYMALLVGTVMVLGITGCAVWPQRYLLTAQPLIAAPGAPLAPGEPDPWQTFKGSSLDAVHFIVQDSQTKCATFINSMFAQTAGTGLTLDVLSTSTSALATVFTPLAATHALSAASTIFGGARTAITAEYLNSLTISHITQAIQSTYSSDMQKYIAWLDTQPAPIDPIVERSKILSYHDECSLASAEGSISNTLQSAASTPTAAAATSPPAAQTGKAITR
jgi:hypothetical protein